MVVLPYLILFGLNMTYTIMDETCYYLLVCMHPFSFFQQNIVVVYWIYMHPLPFLTFTCMTLDCWCTCDQKLDCWVSLSWKNWEGMEFGNQTLYLAKNWFSVFTMYSPVILFEVSVLIIVIESLICDYLV